MLVNECNCCCCACTLSGSTGLMCWFSHMQLYPRCCPFATKQNSAVFSVFPTLPDDGSSQHSSHPCSTDQSDSGLNGEIYSSLFGADVCRSVCVSGDCDSFQQRRKCDKSHSDPVDCSATERGRGGSFHPTQLTLLMPAF